MTFRWSSPALSRTSPGRSVCTPRLVALVLACSIVASGQVRAEAALRGIASRGPSAVTVGDGGRVLFSWPAPHNLGWNAAEKRTTENLNCVSIGDAGYFAVGNGGKVMRSTDTEQIGTAWQLMGSRTTQDLFGLSHGLSKMVAVGDSAVIIRLDAPTGIVWTRVAAEKVPTRKRLVSVSCGPSYTAAVGDSGTIVWSLTSSMDLWTLAGSVPTTENLRGVDDIPGSPSRFFAVGENGTLLRSDGLGSQWTAIETTTTADLNAVTFFGFFGVAVGDGGTILYTNGGSQWQAVDSGTDRDLYAVSYTGSGAGGGFVAVGEQNTILWSAFGNQWQSVAVPARRTSWGSVRGGFR